MFFDISGTGLTKTPTESYTRISRPYILGATHIFNTVNKPTVEIKLDGVGNKGFDYVTASHCFLYQIRNQIRFGAESQINDSCSMLYTRSACDVLVDSHWLRR